MIDVTYLERGETQQQEYGILEKKIGPVIIHKSILIGMLSINNYV